MGSVRPELVLDLKDHGESDGDHHHRRRRVRDPHGEKCRSNHESQDHPRRAPPHRMDDGQGDPSVKVPLLHGEGDHEAPDEEHNDAVEVDRCSFPAAEDSQDGEEYQR